MNQIYKKTLKDSDPEVFASLQKELQTLQSILSLKNKDIDNLENEIKKCKNKKNKEEKYKSNIYKKYIEKKDEIFNWYINSLPTTEKSVCNFFKSLEIEIKSLFNDLQKEK